MKATTQLLDLIVTNTEGNEEEDIPARVLCHDFLFAESLFIKISLHKRKWLFNCSYNPQKKNIRLSDTFSTKYSHIILLGYLNVCIDDETIKTFCNSYCLKSIINQPICIKNPEKTSCIDLILTNSRRSFQNTWVIQTGLSSFHQMAISAIKLHFRRLLSRLFTSRDFKKLDNEMFMNSVQLLQMKTGIFIQSKVIYVYKSDTNKKRK